MAGGGDSDEGDYWPGYVDALTAMVKVLTFVMMLLAVAVFAISQKVSKSAIEQIAKVANIEISSQNGVKDLTEKVIKALKAPPPVPEKKAADGPAPPPPPADSDPGRKVALKELARAAGIEAEAETNPDAAVEKIMEDLRRRETEAKVAPPEIAALPRKEIESTAPPEKPSPDAATEIDLKGELLTLKFADNVIRLDDRTIEEIKTYSADKKDGTFVVAGYAEALAGSISSNRRVAFYRAMMVRQALMKAGVPADRVKVSVRDTTTSGDGFLVKVGMK